MCQTTLKNAVNGGIELRVFRTNGDEMSLIPIPLLVTQFFLIKNKILEKRIRIIVTMEHQEAEAASVLLDKMFGIDTIEWIGK